MRTVLYTEDMEPITVLEVGRWAMEMIERHGYVSFAVDEPLNFAVVADDAATFKALKKVTVYGERLIRYGKRHWLLFTRDEENAMLLKAAFLPGQQQLVNEERARQFARGFLSALARER